MHMREQLPFDIILHEGDTSADLAQEKQILQKECQIAAEHSYHIYQNGSTTERDCMMIVVTGNYFFFTWA